MLSYTLFAFIALNGLLSIIQLFFSKQRKEKIILQQLEKNRIYSLLCLYPALLFLGAGIFIGAVWANVSWGRYWGWDPKEVWALITFLIYSLVLHKNSIKLFSDVFAFHVFSLFAFFSVLMTYFGVNYFLGGLHSYAGSIELGATALIIVSIAVLSVVFVVIGYFHYKTLRTKVYD
jgi:ABC-type transport system involved in cytochrome c biogenesis permease subunit